MTLPGRHQCLQQSQNYRFSEDLDFSLIKPIDLDAILSGLNEIFAIVEAASGINMAYDRHDRHGHQNTHTFYLSYKGPPARTQRRESRYHNQ